MTPAWKRVGGSLLLCSCLIAAACGRPDASPRNLILISIDTLRADHLGCYGYERPTSPNLDALAASGVLFENAWSTAPWTLPAHASLLTGLYPSRHGARTREEPLPNDVLTLAEVLGGYGFETGAVVNALWLTPYYAMAQGFSWFDAVPADQSEVGAAGEIDAQAKIWISQTHERPWFLFLHYFDVHSDYRSRPENERLFAERQNLFEGSTRHVNQIAYLGKELEPAAARRLRGLYDAGIHQLDAELGSFLAWLGNNGWLENSLLIVTSDHGEEFFEHGGVSHGHSLHEELLHVPLLMHGPSIPAGVRVSQPVSLVDVVPTVLALLNVPAVTGLDGRDLRPLWEGSEGSSATRHLLAENEAGSRSGPLRAVLEGRKKLIVDFSKGETALYDLQQDPQETRNLAAQRPEVVRSLEASLERLRASERESSASVELSDELREKLRALGYY